MGKENPIDDSLNEIEKILNLLEKMKGQELNIVDYEAVSQQLNDLDEEVTLFSKNTDELLKDLGATDMRLKEAMDEIPLDLPSDDREALKRAKKLKEETLRLKEEMTGSREFNEKDKGAFEKKKEKMLSKEEHRKKYKRLGSKKKWKPL